MSVLLDVLKVIGAVVLVAFLVLFVIYVGIGVAYLFGMLIAILPFVSGWLTAALPITTAQIPGIVAWIAVFGMITGTSIFASKKGGEE